MPLLQDTTLAKVKSDSQPLSQRYQDALRRVEVDSSLHLPAMAVLEFYDQDLTMVGEAGPLDIGKEIEITMTTDGADNLIFKGSIQALEPVFEQGGTYCNVVVRAYDKLFWLHRGRKSETFNQVTDSDMVRKIAGANGLSAAATATPETHKSVFRDNMSDYEFLKYLAGRNGFVAFVQNGTQLKFAAPGELGKTVVKAEYGTGCLEFRPTVSLAGQVNSVEVRGWDPQEKRVVVGTSSSAGFKPVTNGLAKRGYELAANESGGARVFSVLDPWETAGGAQETAKAIHNRIASGDITAEGTLLGNPKVMPGVTLELSAVSTRFNGKYLVTRVRHRLEQKSAYQTDFWVSGMSTGTFASLLTPDGRSPVEQRRTIAGLMVGIVTNTNDPDALFRVKVKFPTLSDELESFWIPVMGIGAGPQRGFMVLPEVNDEVLVGFEHGDIQRPYVLGGLWNGKDKPPEGQATVQNAGKTEIRSWKTRAGHVIQLKDTAGSESISIIDKSQKNSIVIDTAKNTITIKSGQDIVLEAKQGTIKLEAMNIKMNATQGLEGSGTTGKFESKTTMALKGLTTELVGTTNMKITGLMVMIN